MRLIDADKLLGLFIESGQKHGSEHGCKLGENWLLDYNDIKAVIDNAPTVEPCTDCCESMKQAISEFNANYRKKGKWTYIGISEVTGLKICKCSVCDKRTYGSQHFCPNCGADMRGDV